MRPRAVASVPAWPCCSSPARHAGRRDHAGAVVGRLDQLPAGRDHAAAAPSPSVFTSFVPGTEVPVVLDFTGPRAGGGGEVKGADYAGRDVAIWFFNPT